MKNMKKIALVMALLMAFAALTACSGSASPEGTWKVTNMTGDAFDLGMEGMEMEQLLSSGLIEMTLTFKSGTMTLSMSALGESQSESYSYTVKGDKIIAEGGNEITFKISGSKMTLEAEGGVITLQKK